MKRYPNFKVIGNVIEEVYLFITALLTGEFSTAFWGCILGIIYFFERCISEIKLRCERKKK